KFVDQVEAIHKSLGAYFEATPLQFSQYLSDLHGAKIWLKREDLSPVRSYKIRGAYSFFIDLLSGNPDVRTFVCASAGNHAQGFAHACKTFKRKGVVFMPVTTPQQKIMKTSSFGSPFVQFQLVGDGFDQANTAALQYCEDNNGKMVPPFDHPAVICGQATVGKELLEQFPTGETFDRVVMPVGGGGLASGVTRYLKDRSWHGTFTFVEPDLAPSLKESLSHGKRAKLEFVDNFVDGAAVARIGESNYEILRQFNADDVILAPTDGLCVTMVDMLNVEGIVLEPAGALAIDALKRLPEKEIRNQNIVCVVSGGNFDFERLPEVKERALKYSGLKKYYILQFPQRPGALRDFLMMLGPNDDITRFEYLKKSARNFGSVLLGLETDKAGNFDVLTKKLDEMGMRWQDITDNEIVASLVI
ncbi:MAG: threonine ammonia-lyase IlvA, partial [Rhizobiaceae bacterium]